METPIPQQICMFCQKPADGSEKPDMNKMHEYTNGPCSKCKEHLESGGFIFVSITDRSEPPYKIRRTGYTWYVSKEDAEAELPKDHEILQNPVGSKRIIFARSSECLQLGLMTQEQFNEIEGPPDGKDN